MLQQFEKKVHGPSHPFAAIQGTDCVNFSTLWEGVCTNLFSFNDYVFKSEYVGSKKHSNNAPPSLDDELQGASPLVFCRDYIDALPHDHRVHNLFIKLLARSSSAISFK